MSSILQFTAGNLKNTRSVAIKFFVKVAPFFSWVGVSFIVKC